MSLSNVGYTDCGDEITALECIKKTILKVENFIYLLSEVMTLLINTKSSNFVVSSFIVELLFSLQTKQSTRVSLCRWKDFEHQRVRVIWHKGRD